MVPLCPRPLKTIRPTDGTALAGAVKSLHTFLTGADLPAAQTEAQADERATAILRRVAMLARVGLTPREGVACNPPLVGLLRKLQAALASVEVFPVLYGQAGPPPSSGGLGGYGGRSSYSSRGGGGGGGGVGGAAASSLSSGLSLLTHPLKLRLARHTGDSTLRDYSGNIVLIEPLATMTAIEEFLWPRVYRGPSGGSSAAAAAAAAAQAAAAAAQAAAAAAAAAAERKAGLLRSAAAAGAPGGTSSGRGSPKAAGAGAGAEGAGRSAGGGAGGGAAAAGSAAARSHPIPVAGDSNANRRVTRSQVGAGCSGAGAFRVCTQVGFLCGLRQCHYASDVPSVSCLRKFTSAGRSREG